MSGIQARLTQNDPRLYDANRDLAHCFGEVVRLTNERLEDQEWTILMDFCDQYNLSLDDLGAVSKSFGLFVATATSDKSERRMDQALERVGYFDTKDAAQFAYLAVLGTVCMGFFYGGVKSATMGGVGPCDSLQYLIERGRETAYMLTLPRWKKKLLRIKIRFNTIKDAIFSPAK